MKKNFLIPEIKAFELSAKDVVMNSTLANKNNYVNYGLTGFNDATELNAEYNLWKGQDSWI